MSIYCKKNKITWIQFISCGFGYIFRYSQNCSGYLRYAGDLVVLSDPEDCLQAQLN